MFTLVCLNSKEKVDVVQSRQLISETLLTCSHCVEQDLNGMMKLLLCIASSMTKETVHVREVHSQTVR